MTLNPLHSTRTTPTGVTPVCRQLDSDQLVGNWTVTPACRQLDSIRIVPLQLLLLRVSLPTVYSFYKARKGPLRIFQISAIQDM